MEIRKLSKDYQFVNECGSTRNGFYHRSTLFQNGREVTSAKVNYLNRTWECYTYQTSMKRAISNYIEEKQQYFINRCKEEKGIKRLVKAEREIILKHFEQLKEIKELRAVYKELECRA